MNKATFLFFPFSPFLRFRLCKAIGISALITGFLAGCSSTTAPTVDQQEITPLQISVTQNIPVVRYNRYTLVEVGATAQQQDLLSQTIDVSIPALASQNTSVMDAMRYVLLNSGYQLCADERISVFQSFPLPLAHRQLGPITLKEALNILAGPGWQMQVDHQHRVVCFTPDRPEHGSQQDIEQETIQEVQP